MIVRTNEGAPLPIAVHLSADEALDLGQAIMDACPLPDLAWHDGKAIFDAAWGLLPEHHPVLVEARRQEALAKIEEFETQLGMKLQPYQRDILVRMLVDGEPVDLLRPPQY